MFRSRKGILFSVLCLLIVLALAACGNTTKDTGNNTKPTENSSDSNNSSQSQGELPQGVTDNEILIGMTGPQTGPTAIYDSNRKAMESYFKYVNENGGVNGRQIKLIAYDDQGDPAKAVQAVKRLVEEDKVYALAGSVGAVANLASLDYYVDKGIPAIMLGTGAKGLVDPPKPNVLGLSVINYSVEAKVLLDYTVNELGAKKIAIAYQNDDLGKEGYGAVKESIADYPGVEIVEEVNFLTSDVEFSSQAQKLQNAAPDAILVFSSPNPAANLKKAIHKIGMNDVSYVVCSVGANDTKMFDLAGEKVWNGTISAASIPMPYLSDKPSLELFMKRFAEDYPNEPLVGVSQSGWGTAEVLVEGLRRAGDDLSWDNFIKSFYTMDKYTDAIFAGISFNEKNHYGSTSLFMTEAKSGQIVPISEVMTYDPATGTVTTD